MFLICGLTSTIYAYSDISTILHVVWNDFIEVRKSCNTKKCWSYPMKDSAAMVRSHSEERTIVFQNSPCLEKDVYSLWIYLLSVTYQWYSLFHISYFSYSGISWLPTTRWHGDSPLARARREENVGGEQKKRQNSANFEHQSPYYLLQSL